MDLVKFVLVRLSSHLTHGLCRIFHGETHCLIIEVQKYKTDTFQVLFFPSPTEHFGYLVLVSFTSVFGGLCFFVLFVWFVILLFSGLTSYPRIFPWFFPSLSGLISLVSPFSSIQSAHQTCRRSRRLEKVRPGRRPRKGEEEKDKRPRVWSHHDELDREMGTELTQPLAVPTWSLNLTSVEINM